MYNQRRPARGFTMVEMLMVVALIAVASSMAIVVYNGSVQDSAESVTQATQRQLTNQVNAFYMTHRRQLADGFDSLLRDQTTRPYTGTWTDITGSWFPSQVADNPKDLFHIGYDQINNETEAAGYDNIADPNAWNRGFDTQGNLSGFVGTFRCLTVARLHADEVKTLNDLGITYVYDVDVNYDKWHGEEYLYVKRVLAADDPIVVIDPRTCRTGIWTYQDFGSDLSDTTKYTLYSGPPDFSDPDYPMFPGDLDDAGRLAALNVRYVVLGIGSNCKLIGDRKGGLADVPRSKVVPEGCYDKYLLVIRLPSGAMDMDPAIAGVLDPRGFTPRNMRMWDTRTE